MYSEDVFPFPELLRLGRMPVRIVSLSLPLPSIMPTKTSKLIFLLYLVCAAPTKLPLNQPTRPTSEFQRRYHHNVVERTSPSHLRQIYTQAMLLHVP